VELRSRAWYCNAAVRWWLVAGRRRVRRRVGGAAASPARRCEEDLLTNLFGPAEVGNLEAKNGAVELLWEKGRDSVEKDKSGDLPVSLGAGLALLDDMADDSLFIHEFLDVDPLVRGRGCGTGSSGACTGEVARS